MRELRETLPDCRGRCPTVLATLGWTYELKSRWFEHGVAPCPSGKTIPVLQWTQRCITACATRQSRLLAGMRQMRVHCQLNATSWSSTGVGLPCDSKRAFGRVLSATPLSTNNLASTRPSSINSNASKFSLPRTDCKPAVSGIYRFRPDSTPDGEQDPNPTFPTNNKRRGDGGLEGTKIERPKCGNHAHECLSFSRGASSERTSCRVLRHRQWPKHTHT
jgi:hypothetical protein